uniref:Uncharacterized protein n=1 Tax=Cacopsylla melanoneura TaxID=428564 RepID=A0A8D8LYM0_9HEMI
MFYNPLPVVNNHLKHPVYIYLYILIVLVMVFACSVNNFTLLTNNWFFDSIFRYFHINLTFLNFIFIYQDEFYILLWVYFLSVSRSFLYVPIPIMFNILVYQSSSRMVKNEYTYVTFSL